MNKLLSSSLWSVVHDERQALAQDLEALRPAQWRTPSLCPGWDVHDVLAHLVDTAKTSRLGFLGRMVAAGFDFDRANTAGITRERDGPEVRGSAITLLLAIYGRPVEAHALAGPGASTLLAATGKES